MLNKKIGILLFKSHNLLILLRERGDKSFYFYVFEIPEHPDRLNL